MPKYWSYKEGDRVEANETAPEYLRGKRGVITHLRENIVYDYEIKFDDFTVCRLKESELKRLFSTKDKVRLKSTGEQGEITHVSEKDNQASVLFKDRSSKVHNLSELENLCKFEILSRNEEGKTLVNQGFKLGDFTIYNTPAVSIEIPKDTNKTLNILLKHYENEDGTYTVPKQLMLNLINSIQGV